MVASHKYSAESKRRLDRVFNCFLFCGAVALFYSITSLLAAAAVDRAGSWLLAVVGLTLLFALAVAARYSIRVWRRRSVRLLWAATFVLPLVLLLQVSWLSVIASWLYAVVAIGVPLWWFLHERKATAH